MIWAAMLCFACSDDESFTTDASARLTFSVDTVSFDTAFCDICSSTERLIVYNRGSKGLRLQQVTLESGGQAGFRMNVDGLAGTSVTDVEIPARDSIFIFLNATAVQQGENADRIFFTLESGVQQSVALNVYGQKAIELRKEVISKDTRLTDELPYIIYDSLVVAPGACLTLEAGTALHFHKNADLVVHGSLKIEGEAGREVVLRCDRLDKLLYNLPYDLTDAQWGGVRLASDCTGCDIRFADIHGGTFGIDCDSIAGKLSIHNSTIHNVAGDALHIRRTDALVANSQITNALGDCVNLVRATADFYHCTIAQFYRWSINRGNAVNLTTPDARFFNCLITGYADDEVFAQIDAEATDVPLHFYSCIVNTDVGDTKYFTDCVAESEDSTAYKREHFAPSYVPYKFSFVLDSISYAIGRGNPEYTKLYPVNRNGEAHDARHPNVGCY